MKTRCGCGAEGLAAVQNAAPPEDAGQHFHDLALDGRGRHLRASGQSQTNATYGVMVDVKSERGIPAGRIRIVTCVLRERRAPIHAMKDMLGAVQASCASTCLPPAGTGR